MRAVGRSLLICGLLYLPLSAAGQSSRTLTTETTVTWGRGGFAYQGAGSDAVATADLGWRWTRPSGVARGFSLAGGYDAANEAFLVGGRGRYSRPWRQHVWEASLALFFSSLDDGAVGGVVGVAFYPAPWGAFVLQLDLMPTNAQIGCRAGEVCDGPRTLSGGSDLAISYGLRVAERPALFSWLGAGLLGLGAWAFAGELGCC
jgi:hypothetical protein